MSVVYVEVVPRAEDVASCLHCGQLILLIPWPFEVEGDDDPGALAWNPDYADYPAIVALLDEEAMHRQGFGPRCTLHMEGCEGLAEAGRENFRKRCRDPRRSS